MKKMKQVPILTKKMVEVEEITGMNTVITEEEGGYILLLGKKVFFHCMNYHYSGTLVGINTTCIELADAYVVFSTGSYTDKKWADAQRTHSGKAYINVACIEAFWEIP